MFPSKRTWNGTGSAPSPGWSPRDPVLVVQLEVRELHQVLLAEMLWQKISTMGYSYGSVQKWEHHGIMGICIHSGKQPNNELENHHAINGTIHYLSTISMVIFNSYFDITRG
jgi:hypothetical protein